MTRPRRVRGFGSDESRVPKRQYRGHDGSRYDEMDIASLPTKGITETGVIRFGTNQNKKRGKSMRNPHRYWFFPSTGVLAAAVLAFGAGSLATGDGAATVPARTAAALGVCQSPANIPQGFDYPKTPATVDRWVANGDAARAREHGWYLWAGLNTPAAGGPVWRSWCTSTQAFDFNLPGGPTSYRAARAGGGHRLGLLPLLAIRRARGEGRTEDPINLPNPPGYPVPDQVRAAYPQCYVPPSHPNQFGGLRDGPTFQSNGDVMVAGVIYNQLAYNWIRSRGLYLAATLNPLVPPSDRTASIPVMPLGSMALKPMMWPIPRSGFTALPLWDAPASDHDSYAGFEVPTMWPRAVAVGAMSTRALTADVTTFYGLRIADDIHSPPREPVTYRAASIAPLSSFYSFTPRLQGMDPCDRAILDASAWWAYGRRFEQGDHLALVAMHVMSKERAAWTFQSVWWHDQPDRGPYALDRPAIPASRAPGPWRHYLLTSTYGIPNPQVPTQWPIAFNPYIELAAAHPIRTNCMNCHHRAAWPGQSDGYEANGGPDALTIFRQNNPIFNGLLQADALWSIPDRAGPPPAAARSATRPR
jgi:hypothetical protein